jgi:hypothetical protein
MNGEDVRTFVSFAALAVSIVAALIARSSRTFAALTLRLNSRPIVRVVATEAEAGDSDSHTIDLKVVKVKNVGRGHAITLVVFEPTRHEIMKTLDVLEPLGSGQTEATRLGNVTLELDAPMLLASDYAIYYQDVFGDWHRTLFRPNFDTDRIDNRFHGVVTDVPQEVVHLATIVRP